MVMEYAESETCCFRPTMGAPPVMISEQRASSKDPQPKNRFNGVVQRPFNGKTIQQTSSISSTNTFQDHPHHHLCRSASAVKAIDQFHIIFPNLLFYRPPEPSKVFHLSGLLTSLSCSRYTKREIGLAASIALEKPLLPSRARHRLLVDLWEIRRGHSLPTKTLWRHPLHRRAHKIPFSSKRIRAVIYTMPPAHISSLLAETQPLAPHDNNAVASRTETSRGQLVLETCFESIFCSLEEYLDGHIQSRNQLSRCPSNPTYTFRELRSAMLQLWLTCKSLHILAGPYHHAVLEINEDSLYGLPPSFLPNSGKRLTVNEYGSSLKRLTMFARGRIPGLERVRYASFDVFRPCPCGIR
jgi:hypothetical protein